MNTNNFSNTTETNNQTQTPHQTGVEKKCVTHVCHTLPPKTPQTTKQTPTKQTTFLQFRINSIVKQKYMELTANKKKIVKLALETIIFSLAEDKEDLERVAKELGLELAKESIQPILNINVNINEAKAEAKAEIDISKLIEAINGLQRLLLEIQKNNFNVKQNAYILPPARMKDIEKFMEDLRRLVN